MTTETGPSPDAVTVSVPRKLFDRRFLKVLACSAVVVGGAAVALRVHARRAQDPALVAAQQEDRVHYLRAFVRRQEERAQREDPRADGSGARHAASEGRLGGRRYAVRGNPAPHLARSQAQEAVANQGIFAALGAPGGAGGNGIVSPFGGLTESGADAQSAHGNLTGTAIGDAFGQGGLGVMGHGSGGGGIGYGYGNGRGRGGGASSHGYAAPVVSQPTVVIDPNGRFATTYRPGHGHLAWFDAAVARGEIPQDTRDVLADLGSNADPVIAPPTDKALDLQLDLERAALSPGGGGTHLRLALRSSAAQVARPVMSVHLVMDISGSMSGAPMEHARQAAHALVERLADGDHFSLTVFSSDARVEVPEGRVAGRRTQIWNRIAALDVEGGTNISAGLALGYGMAARGPAVTEANRIVMLLSDGEPTDGITDRQTLSLMAARALQDGTETSSFGVGTSYDGALMSSLADRGAGGYYYIPDSSRIADALRTELEARAQPVAQAVEVRVRLADGIALTEVYGSRKLEGVDAEVVRGQEVALDRRTAARDHIAQDRHTDRAGGMRFFIPGFARDDRHVLLLGLRAPAGVGDRPVATVELRYKDRLTGRNVTIERPVRSTYAASDAASAATANPSVQRTVQSFDAGLTLVEAARAVSNGERERASALLAERESLLRQAAVRLGAPSLEGDASRLGRVRTILGGGASASPVALAMLLDTSARGFLR
jgi:Mg-chelatase subunit ChlD